MFEPEPDAAQIYDAYAGDPAASSGNYGEDSGASD